MFAPIQLNGYQTPFSAHHPAPQHNERVDKVYRVLLHSEEGIVIGGDAGAKWNDPLEFDIHLDDILLDKSNYQMAVESLVIGFDDQNTGQTVSPFAIKLDGLSVPNSYDTKSKNKSHILMTGNFGDGQSMIYNTITPDTYGIPIGNLDLKRLKVHIINGLTYGQLTENHFGTGHGKWILGLIFYPIK